MIKIKNCVLFTLILSLVLISGCTYGSYTTTGSIQISTLSKMSMSYKKFNGYKITELNIKEGEEYQVNVSIVSEEGKLGLTIALENDKKDRQDETIYKGSELPTSDFKVTLDKPGKYLIKVTGENHKGKFNITWDKVNEK